MDELSWFKQNKYLSFIPINWEGYLSYLIILCLVIFSFFYFDVLSFSFSNILFFIISLIFIFVLFAILSKNTTQEKLISKITPKTIFKPALKPAPKVVLKSEPLKK